MTEKEKMLSSKAYNANYDEELLNERKKAKDLCYEYNSLKPSELRKRNELIKEILGSTKDIFLIEQPFICDYGYNIEIGDKFYSNHNLTILDVNKVKFGDNVFIGPNCSIYTAEHPLNATLRAEGLESGRPIEIGNNVWIGGDVVILPGVKIGDNTVIGARSLVTRDIPPNVLAYGSPCKVVKELNN